MYFDRVLNPHEALFVSRAQQRIATLGAELAVEFENNDVTVYKRELINELQYAIESLQTTDLTWTADEIQLVIDYYTVEGNLNVYPFREITFDPTPIAQECDCDAIIQMINNLTNTVNSNYTELLNYINQVDASYKAADIAIYEYIDNLTLGGSGSLTEDITSGQDVGGIDKGDEFLLGTPIEEVIKELLKETPEGDNLSYTGAVELIEVGSSLAISQFVWDMVGTPTNLVLSDSEGQLTNQPVTGVQYIPGAPINYDTSSPKTITWTLSADDMDDVTLSTRTAYKSYFDKEVTANDSVITVTEAKILSAVTQVLQITEDSIAINVATSNTEQGFIAVPKTQSQPDYTKWRVNDNNNSVIATGEFIRPPVDVTVNGVVYSVYRWGYRSPLSDTLILHR